MYSTGNPITANRHTQDFTAGFAVFLWLTLGTSDLSVPELIARGEMDISNCKCLWHVEYEK